MAGFDLTDVGGNLGETQVENNQPVFQVRERASRNPFEAEQQAQIKPAVDKGEVERTIIKEEVPEEKEKLWSITSEAHSGGQFKAGEVDKEHVEFLKKTEFVE